MFKLVLFSVIVSLANCNEEKDYRVVNLEQGIVAGEKYWDGDFYQFYGIPYAKQPTGKDKYKPPLPAEKWEGTFVADKEKIICHQTFYTGENPDDIYLAGEDDCLILNLLVPKVATKKNPVPVVVYVHSGAFAAGSGNMAKYFFLARHDVIVVSFNFRLGAHGFLCLGNEEAPGNAGLKDALAALKWIKKNIHLFGGDPNKITLAGFSVGAALAELLVLAKPAQGLVDQLILESGSALAPYAINRDPLGTAVNIARSMGYNGTTMKELTDFYLTVDNDKLVSKSLNFFLPNSTFGYAPCIENDVGSFEPFLTESPLDILKKGDYKKIPVLTGFAEMEGLSRTVKFNTWIKIMKDNLADFIPADLKFDDVKSRDEFVKKIREFYFKNKEISEDSLVEYIEYFSDAMFRYSIIKSANLHAANSKRPVFFYEFSFVGTLSMPHNFYEKVQGASHRDQSSYILDFYSFTNDVKDLTIRDRLTWMWTDFVKYENPTAYESLLVNYQWRPYTVKNRDYLRIDLKSEMRKDLPTSGYNFWDKIYEKHHWHPQAPNVKVDKHI